MLAQESFLTGWWQTVLDFLEQHPTAAVVLAPLLLLVVWLLTLLVGRRLLLALVNRLAKRTSTDWDDLVVESRVLHRLSHAIPLAMVLVVIDGLPGINDVVRTWISRIAGVGLVVVVVLSLHALLDGLHIAYKRKQDGQRRPIKGYVQLVKLIATVGGVVIGIATLLGSNVGSLVTGIGLSTAVVLFVFKDTIMSLLASIHLTAYDMVRIGDWVEMPKHGADGDVIDIALHTVKVQNFDKTITTVPTFELYAASFKNWRGMQDSGGRRIKRSLFVDVSSIRFLEADDVERLSKVRLLRDYLEEKKTSVVTTNAELGEEATQTDRRRLTNVGTFRAYCVAYLKAHPNVHPDMTLLVRQLQPTERGLPIELYVFTSTTSWADYENIQADIFDHLLAVAREFDLRIFQLPTGSDLAALTGRAPTG